MTEKINSLFQHVSEHKKDKSTKRGFQVRYLYLLCRSGAACHGHRIAGFGDAAPDADAVFEEDELPAVPRHYHHAEPGGRREQDAHHVQEAQDEKGKLGGCCCVLKDSLLLPFHIVLFLSILLSAPRDAMSIWSLRCQLVGSVLI